MYFDKSKEIGDLRPNQIITSFGPGAVIDAVKDSVTVLDTNYWKEKGEQILDGRMASYLGVDTFYSVRTSEHSEDIPVVSFPHYHVCSNPKCGRLFDIRESMNIDNYVKHGPTCPDCHRDAYPSRFITICENGHMDDFPWRWWVHRGDTNCKGKLKVYTMGSSSTLSDIHVECSCGAHRSMAGAMQKENFAGLKCTGHHPFRPVAANEDCKKEVIPSQRGASNVYFSVVRSAITIPPWRNPLYALLEKHWANIEMGREVYGDMALDMNYNKFFSSWPRKDFDDAVAKRIAGVKDFIEMKQGEYDAILHHADALFNSMKKDFDAEEDEVPDSLKKYFSRIIRVTRLREVKVLLGFTRGDASDPDAESQPNTVHLSKGDGTAESWLPAAETIGEGVFIEFNRDTINKWLSSGEVAAISKQYGNCYREYCAERNWTVNVIRDAAYVLMHTMAHLLIKQMAMFSGYSSTAIRERIYFSEKMNGILLYTGSSDKEGSLGGLVELGSTDKLMKLMRDAFQEALLCTNDPECLNNLPNGTDANGAACHSCCMISETSCENGNRMLDRGLVVPIAGREKQAYFRELVADLCQLEA